MMCPHLWVHYKILSSALRFLHPYQFPTPIFPRFSLLPQSWFSQQVGTPGTWQDVLYWMLRYVSTVCVKEDGSLMHQDFGANARVPPKSAPGRLENASSAVSLPNQCPGPSPSLSVHYLHLQSVFTHLNPNLS